MKKITSRAISVIISLALILSALSCVFAGMSASADSAPPVFDAADHAVVTTSDAFTVVEDAPSTLYGTITLTTNANNAQYNGLYLFLGETTVDYTAESTGDTVNHKEGRWIIKVTGGDGIDMQLVGEDNGTIFYWGANAPSLLKPKYIDSNSVSFQGPYTLDWIITDDSLKVWMTAGDTTQLIYDLDFASVQADGKDFKITNKMATGWTTIGAFPTVTDYKVWTDIPAPVYDESVHNIVTTSDTFAVVEDAPSTLYGTVTLTTNANNAQYNGLYLFLGETTVDYTAESTGDTVNHKEGRWIIKVTGGDGIDMQLVGEDNGTIFYWGANAPSLLKPKYIDSNSVSFQGPYTLDWIITDDSLKVWMTAGDATQLIYDLDFASVQADGKDFKITNKMATGWTTIGAFPTVTDYKVWANASEYGEAPAPSVPVSVPEFDAETDYDLTADLTVTEKGDDLAYELTEDGYTIESEGEGFGDGTDNGIILDGVAVKEGSTVYYRTILKGERTLASTQNEQIYGGPAIRLAKATYYTNGAVEKEGYLDILFTEKDKIDVRLRDADGMDMIYVGARTADLKMSYPDTNSGTRGADDYEVVVALTDDGLFSLWINDTVMLDEFDLNNLDSATSERYIAIDEFVGGLMFKSQIGSAEELTVWTARNNVIVPAPEFDAENDYDFTPGLTVTEKGDDLAYELTEDGYTIESEGEGFGDGTDNGIILDGVAVKEGATVYYRTILKGERTLASTQNEQIYGGPAIRLAKATYYRDGAVEAEGYLDILFTEQDKIDVRLRDADGIDKIYIGARTPDLKLNYPDTGIATRGADDYEVIVALTDSGLLSMWINGEQMLDAYDLSDLSTPTSERYLTVDEFVGGLLIKTQIGSAEELTVWAAKDDVDETVIDLTPGDKEDDKVDDKEDDKVDDKEDDKVDDKEDDKVDDKEDNKVDDKEDGKDDGKGTEVPKTGDSNACVWMIGVLMLGAAGLLVFRKRVAE